MKAINIIKERDNIKKYERYKKVIRNLRRGSVEKISSKKTSNNFTTK